MEGHQHKELLEQRVTNASFVKLIDAIWCTSRRYGYNLYAVHNLPPQHTHDVHEAYICWHPTPWQSWPQIWIFDGNQSPGDPKYRNTTHHKDLQHPQHPNYIQLHQIKHSITIKQKFNKFRVT